MGMRLGATQLVVRRVPAGCRRGRAARAVPLWERAMLLGGILSPSSGGVGAAFVKAKEGCGTVHVEAHHRYLG